MKEVLFKCLLLLPIMLLFSCDDDDGNLGVFHGQITDITTQEPLSDAIVVIRNDGQIEVSTITDDDGMFETKELEVLPYDFRVLKDGYVEAKVTGREPDEIRTRVDFLMKPLPSMTGIVFDHENEGLEGVQLVISRPDGYNLSRVTNEHGYYHFERIEEGTFMLVAKKPGFITEDFVLQVEAGEPTTKNFPLYSLACIHGTVTDKNGDPIENVLASLSLNNENLLSKQTNALGNFNFEGLEANTYSLVISKDGYQTIVDRNLEVLEGKPTEVAMVLKELPFISGMVVDENNDALEGVKITLSGNSLSNPVTYTDSQGQYRFSGLELGEYGLLFEKEGFKSESRSISLQEQSSNISVNSTLIANASIVGTTVDIESSELLSGITVSLTLDGKEVLSRSSNLQGVFTFHDLEEGAYQLQAIASGYEHLPVEMAVKKGENKQTTLLMQPLPSILSLNTNSLNFGAVEDRLALDIENTGEGVMKWEIDTEIEGITVEPATGSTPPSVISTVIIKLDRSLIRHGNYARTLTIKTEKAGSKAVNLNYDVIGKICANVESLDFGTESKRSFEISNCGHGIVQFKLETDKPWVKAIPSSGTLAQSAKAIEIQIERGGLPPANYESLLTISSEGSVSNIALRMTVKEPKAAQLSISTSFLDFGTKAKELPLYVTNSGEENLIWKGASQSSWLSLSITKDTLSSEESQLIKVKVSRDKLPKETISTGLIQFTSENNAGEAEVEVTASTVSDPFLTVSKNLLNFGAQGDRLDFEIIKTGVADLGWTLIPSANWINVSASSGINNELIYVTIDRSLVSGETQHIGNIEVRADDGTEQVVEIRMNKRSVFPRLQAQIEEVSVEATGDVALVPDQKARLKISLTNLLGDEIDFAQNVWAELKSNSPYLSLDGVAKQYGDLDQGQQVTQEFELSVAEDAPLGESISLILTAWDANGFSVDLPLVADVQPAFSNGLASYFTFDNGQAEDLVKDFFANGVNTVISDDTPNGTGKSFDFNAQNGAYIRMGTNLIQGFNDQATFNLWLKTESVEGFMMLLHASQSEINRNLLGIDQDDQIYAAGITFSGSIKGNLMNGQWHMLTVVLAPTGNLLYVDREQISTSQKEHDLRNLAIVPEGFTIGRRGNKPDSYYHGLMDNIRLYKRALSINEIEALFEFESGN